MGTFIDTAGREWPIALNVGTAKRVQIETGINLYRLLEGEFSGLAELLADPIKLAGVVWALVKPDALTRGVSAETFLESLSGEVLERAGELLIDGILDFFPPRRREVLRRILEAARALNETKLRELETKVAELDRATIPPSSPSA
jgi:hypothetical protein